MPKIVCLLSAVDLFLEPGLLAFHLDSLISVRNIIENVRKSKNQFDLFNIFKRHIFGNGLEIKEETSTIGLAVYERKATVIQASLLISFCFQHLRVLLDFSV